MNWNEGGFNPANTGLNAAAQGKRSDLQITGTKTISTISVADGVTVSPGPVGTCLDYPRPTNLASHVETRIARLESDVKRLREIKSKLAKPTGALEVTLDDMRFLLNY